MPSSLTSRVSCFFSTQRSREPLAPMLYPETGRQGAVTLGTVQTVMWVPSSAPMVSGTGGQPGTAMKGEPDFWHLAFFPLGSFSLCGHPTFPTSYFQRTSSSQTPRHHLLIGAHCMFILPRSSR